MYIVYLSSYVVVVVYFLATFLFFLLDYSGNEPAVYRKTNIVLMLPKENKH